MNECMLSIEPRAVFKVCFLPLITHASAPLCVQDAHPIGEVDSGDSQDASHIHAFKQAAEEKDDASQVLLLVVDDGDNSGRLHSRRLVIGRFRNVLQRECVSRVRVVRGFVFGFLFLKS